MDYDRYSKFRVNGGTQLVPFIPIPVKDTDYYEIYEKGKTRLDLLSYQYSCLLQGEQYQPYR